MNRSQNPCPKYRWEAVNVTAFISLSKYIYFALRGLHAEQLFYRDGAFVFENSVHGANKLDKVTSRSRGLMKTLADTSTHDKDDPLVYQHCNQHHINL